MQSLAQVHVILGGEAGIELLRQCIEFLREQDAQCGDRIGAAKTADRRGIVEQRRGRRRFDWSGSTVVFLAEQPGQRTLQPFDRDRLAEHAGESTRAQFALERGIAIGRRCERRAVPRCRRRIGT